MESKPELKKLGSEKIKFEKGFIVSKSRGEMTDKYNIEHLISTETYGEVLKVKNKTTGDKYLCKKILKSQIENNEEFENDIKIMQTVDHPSITKWYEIFEDKRAFYIIMEECKGGEFFEKMLRRIETNNMYTEPEAAEKFKQIVSAVCYCHEKNISHKNLIPEKILFYESKDDSPIKVIDFGLSSLIGGKMNTKLPSIYYVSPEALKGQFDKKSDIWSLGVLLYVILSGNIPFNGNNEKEVSERILKGEFSFKEEEWENISKEAKELISKLLSPYDKRPNAQEILEDPWVKNLAPNGKGQLKFIKYENLKNYCNSNKLKKAVITYIASRLNQKEVKNLKDIFVSIDLNNDGVLTLKEMEKGLQKLKKKYPDFNVEEVFNSIDTDKSGKIDYTEFIAACLDKKYFLQKERLEDAFKMLDKDNSKTISKDEIKEVLKGEDDVDDAVLQQYIDQYDKNKNGEIDYEEFLEMMQDFNIK
ncbi:MAG: protein kinase [archaeon]|nr:protein kinase [archaeon]